MQSINRFLYGPTAEEKIRAWQGKLRAEQRQLDREMRQVGLPAVVCPRSLHNAISQARHCDKQGTTERQAACDQGRCEVGTDTRAGGCTE